MQKELLPKYAIYLAEKQYNSVSLLMFKDIGKYLKGGICLLEVF